MGMTKCQIHGLTFIQPCCEHIGNAIEARRYEHANVLVDTFGAPIVLCDACLLKAAENTIGAQQWITIELDIGAEIWPYCSACLKEWYESTGQGDLSVTIAQVKESSK